MKHECLNLRRKHGPSKKSLMAIWKGLNSGSDSNTNEHANIYLIANTKQLSYKLDLYLDIASDTSCSSFDEDKTTTSILMISSLVVTLFLINILSSNKNSKILF